MTARKYVVRVVLPFDMAPIVMMMVECLREAGFVIIHRDNKDGMCFDVMPFERKLARGLEPDTQCWATNLAVYMSKSGFNAVCAPEWVDNDGPPYDAATATGMYDRGEG